MTTGLYPMIETTSPEALAYFAQEIARQREQDVEEFSNLSNIFIRGRKVDKIPTGSTDVTNDDRVGDFNFDTSYLYICVDNSGTATWRRVAIGSW